MFEITIISPGPLSTVQDEGRFGYMSSGFSSNGAMDDYSMKTANILVGNSPRDGVLEMTLMGISARFECDTVIALTGADMKPEINGRKIEMYKAVGVYEGDVLTMGAASKGMRCYLAAAGGFDIPLVMGSMSTDIKCGIGGFCGRKLAADDRLPLRRSLTLPMVGKRRTAPENDYSAEITLRVVLGPQDDYFTERGISDFLSTEYILTEKSDRMGLRLDGKKIENKNGVDIISDGIAAGSVQIPASGTPIIMMADRQTTGGYAKIATVISADLKKAAQARPGTKVRFSAVSEKTAVRLKRAEARKLGWLEYASLFASGAE